MPEQKTRVGRKRPLSGAILGVLIGLAVAVLLQQQGVWPLDKITVFLLPSITGAIGLALTSVKRVGGRVTMIIAFITIIPMAAWGATGLTTLNEVGQLNGGCQVQSQTSAPDATTVTDTSKQDPFLIDPNGSLAWGATSPVAFMDYDWDLWVEIGGFQVPLDSDHEDNEGGSQINGGDVPNVTQYAEARGIDISQLRGVYKVGGQAADTCSGFGFVKLIAEPLETIIAKIAAALAALLTIILLIMAFSGRTPTVVPVGPGSEDSDLPGSDLADADGGEPDASISGASAEGGSTPSATDGDEDVNDLDTQIFSDGFESGDTSAWSDGDD